MSNDKEDIKNINARLKELNKEFQDLSALKKKIMSTQARQNYTEKYGEYKYLVKDKETKEFDIQDLLDNNDLKITTSRFGMMCAAYTVGPNQVSYHIARTEEEAEQVRIVQSLFSVGEEISELIGQKKTLSAAEILEKYDGARAGLKLQQLDETEEVPS